jgi:NAD-dependent histone deacetylase SIR2
MTSIFAMEQADLLIVIGTSLTVHPFASLAGMARKSCPRVLINIERVGDIGSRKGDVVLLGKCDEIVRELCAELGWGEELEEVWAETASTVEVTEDGEKVDDKNKGKEREEEGGEGRKEKDLKSLKREVDFLTAAIEARLALHEKAKGEKEKTKDGVREKERKNTDREPLISVPSSLATGPTDKQSGSSKEVATSTTNPRAEARGVSVKEGVGNVDGKL